LSERIPAELKIKGIKSKYILKKAAESLLPKEIIWRKKAGFGAPIRSWLRTSLKPMIDDLLSEETVKKRGLFDFREVHKIIELNQSGKEDFNLQVFQLLNFEIWMREFLD
jgi:asparagine synthase (glutamine-hydrolysing)